MKVKIEQSNIYNITINGKVYPFTKESEWEGMVKYKSTQLGIMIIARNTGIDQFLEDFGMSVNEKTVITASQPIIDLLLNQK